MQYEFKRKQDPKMSKLAEEHSEVEVKGLKKPIASSVGFSPTVIILSGLPCVGKSFWCKIFLENLQPNNLSVAIVSIDEVVYQLCDKINAEMGISTIQRQNSDSNPIDFDGVEPMTFIKLWKTNEALIKQKFFEEILLAVTNNSVVVLDDVFMTEDSRREVLLLVRNVSATARVAYMSFIVSNEGSYYQKLDERNALKPNKQLSRDLISSLKEGCSPPRVDEGVAQVWICPAVTENGFEGEQQRTARAAAMFVLNEQTNIRNVCGRVLTIFVTGAGRGLGKGLVEYFLQSTTEVLVFAGVRNIDQARCEWPLSPENLVFVSLDVEDEDSIAAASKFVASRSNHIDIIFNNAGVSKGPATAGATDLVCKLKSFDKSCIMKMFSVNAIGPMLVAKHFVSLLRNEPAYVINISSGRASYHDEDPNSNANYGYRASKAALNMFTFCSVTDMPRNVRTCAFHPGSVQSAMNPSGLITAIQSAANIHTIVTNWREEFNGRMVRWDPVESKCILYAL